MGPDVERLLGIIEIIIDSGRNSATNALVTENTGDHQHSVGNHPHYGGSHVSEGSGSHSHDDGIHMHDGGNHAHMELVNRHIAVGSFSNEVTKIRAIAAKCYRPINQVNNSLGSPFNEIYSLDYIRGFSDTLGGLLATINAAVDAKYAIQMYADSLQRGYDDTFNGGKPSIVTDDFVRGSTDGNVGSVKR